MFSTLFPQEKDLDADNKKSATNKSAEVPPINTSSEGKTSEHTQEEQISLSKTSDVSSAPKSKAAFRTISEAATEIGVATHVLRFWETKFPQIQPMKRSNGRRYYRSDDVDFLIKICTLLHDKGFTIKGVQKALKDGTFERALATPSAVKAETIEISEKVISKAIKAESKQNSALIKDFVDELKQIRKLLDA